MKDDFILIERTILVFLCFVVASSGKIKNDDGTLRYIEIEVFVFLKKLKR